MGHTAEFDAGQADMQQLPLLFICFYSIVVNVHVQFLYVAGAGGPVCENRTVQEAYIVKVHTARRCSRVGARPNGGSKAQLTRQPNRTVCHSIICNL